MMRQLPDAQREAVALRHIGGLPIAEVATLLGCPQGTAKSHVSRGLRQLRAQYQDQATRDTDAVVTPAVLSPVEATGTRRGSPATVSRGFPGGSCTKEQR
jgi:hypothetical protein